MPEPEANRASVLGEFGGLGLPIEGHLWVPTELGLPRHERPRAAHHRLPATAAQAPAAGVQGPVRRGLHQTTDVEGEVNGLLTYDRAMLKMPPKLWPRPMPS